MKPLKASQAIQHFIELHSGLFLQFYLNGCNLYNKKKVFLAYFTEGGLEYIVYALTCKDIVLSSEFIR